MTAPRSLVQYHDVTWIASAITDDDRPHRRRERCSRRLRARRLALPRAASSRTTLRPTTGTTTSSSNPMLWFSAPRSLGSRRTNRGSTLRFTKPGAGRVRRGQRELSRPRSTQSCARTPDADRLLPRLSPVPRADVLVRSADRTPHSCTSSTSLGRRRTTGRILPRTMRSAIHEGLIANDVVGFHTDRWRRNFIYSVRELLGEDVTAKTVTAPISVDPAEFDRAGGATPCLSAERELRGESPREAGRASRPHGSLEEHRARLPGVRAVPRRRIRKRIATSACSRCSTRRGRTFRSTPSISARSSERRVASTIAFSRAAGGRSTCRSRTTFRTCRRGVQAVRRAARQRDLRRHEPRREGSAARESA